MEADKEKIEAEKARIEALALKFNLEKGLVGNLVKSEPATQKAFFDVVTFSGLKEGEKKMGNMLYSIATKLPITIERFRKPLAGWVGFNEISNPNQLDFTIEYLKAEELKGGADLEQLKKACGVGVKLTPEEIKAIVENHIATAN
jgi:glutaminyl-tRNA synthetase